jgi:hypothetical protein
MLFAPQQRMLNSNTANVGDEIATMSINESIWYNNNNNSNNDNNNNSGHECHAKGTRQETKMQDSLIQPTNALLHSLVE